MTPEYETAIRQHHRLASAQRLPQAYDTGRLQAKCEAYLEDNAVSVVGQLLAALDAERQRADVAEAKLRTIAFAELDAFLEGRKCLGTGCDEGHTYKIGCLLSPPTGCFG